MAVQVKQLWNGEEDLTDDRGRNKLNKDEFRVLFQDSEIIETLEERSLGGGMFLFDVKYRHSPKVVHIIYQDLRSGDEDNDGRKRFQVGKVAMHPNEAYFYLGGYDAGDYKLFISILTHAREINEGLTSISSLWFDWDNLVKIYYDGILMWNYTFRRKHNLAIIGCRNDHLDLLHDAFISRSLDNYIPEAVPTEPIVSPTQKIYYGAPGGGKSHRAKEKTAGYDVHRITFHPDTDYASFVGSYKPIVNEHGIVRDLYGKPVKDESDNKIEYKFVPQIFTNTYLEAWKSMLNDETPKPVCILIEELNRGNCAQIFGDLFQLLDRSKKGFSEYSVIPTVELAQYIKGQLTADEFEKYYKEIRTNSDLTDAGIPVIPEWDSTNISNNKLRLCLPPNLSIVCTMNTSDQSLFPMDSAFKRRWDWEYVPIDNDCQESRFAIRIDDGYVYDWSEFLKVVNVIIAKETHSEDKQMGNFFVKGNEDMEVDCKQFVSKVMYYLWSEVCKDNPKARKELFASLIDKGEGPIQEDFTFPMLFSKRRTEILSGFMSKLGLDNISSEIVYDFSEMSGETEKERWEHELYFDEFIDHINKDSSSAFVDFKEKLPGNYKTHLNGFVVRPSFGGWISLSRNKDANLVCYGNTDIKLMEQIFDAHGIDISMSLGIPKDKETKKRSASRWQFTDKQGQAKLASPHSLNKEEEYEWFIDNAIRFYDTFKGYIESINASTQDDNTL